MTAWSLISQILKELERSALPGVNLLELERKAANLIDILDAVSINKGYFPKWAKSPYPATTCMNVNDTVAHCPPYDYILKNGDLLMIDLGIKHQGICADAALTVPVGDISNRDERLLRYAKQALLKGIAEVRTGNKITDPGEVIEIYAKRNGFVVNKRLHGHGIGTEMHEEPTIPMFYLGHENLEYIKDNGKKAWKSVERENIPVFQEGQIVCIEPHLTYSDEIAILEGDWKIVNRDGRKSAMFEHMVRVTSLGAEILTTHI